MILPRWKGMTAMIGKYRGMLLGSIIGLAVGVGGFAAAQSFLGPTTLMVNGQKYGGSFTPLEANSDLYVPISQLSAAMGFTYTWKDSALTIDTAGYTPPSGASSSPLQLRVTVKNASALTVLPAALLNSTSEASHYDAVTVGYRYEGQAVGNADQPIEVTVTGMPLGDAAIELTIPNFSDRAFTPQGNGVFVIDKGDMSSTFKTRQIRVGADVPGTVQLTFSDPKDSQVPPQSITLHFMD